jgi:hypothetical protein
MCLVGVGLIALAVVVAVQTDLADVSNAAPVAALALGGLAVFAAATTGDATSIDILGFKIPIARTAKADGGRSKETTPPVGSKSTGGNSPRLEARVEESSVKQVARVEQESADGVSWDAAMESIRVTSDARELREQLRMALAILAEDGPSAEQRRAMLAVIKTKRSLDSSECAKLLNELEVKLRR